MLDDELKADASRAVAGIDAALAPAVEHFGRLPSDLIPEGSPLRWYGAALHYWLRDPGPSVGADKAFAPMLETSTGVYPDPLGEVPDEAKELWDFGAALSMNPGVAARLHHLCFAAGTLNRGAHLREAAAAYLTLGQHADVSRLERVAALRWALELSGMMRDEGRVSAVLDALVKVAEAGLAEGPREPGVALRAISAIVGQRREDPRLPALLDQAEASYTEAYHRSSIAELRRKAAQGDREELARVNRAETEAWLAEAMAASGPVRMMHLERTIELARNHGLGDIAETATRELQAGGRDAWGMVSMSHSVEVPREAIDAWMKQFTSASGLLEALQCLVAQGPPSGSLEDTRQSVDWQAENAPLSTLFRPARVTHHGLPAWTPTTPEEEEDEKLAHHEILKLQMQGPLLAEALRRALETFGVDEDLIRSALTAEPYVPASAAKSIAGALRHYAAGDWEASECVVAPRIETLARSIALAAGAALWRTQQGHTQGQYPGVGALLGELRDAGLDPSWYRFLWTFLASPAGANHRNELAHGLLDNFGPVNAALLIIAALYLVAIAHFARSQTSAADGADEAPPAAAS